LRASAAILAAGHAAAHTAVSALEMMISMFATAVIGILGDRRRCALWRLAPKLSEKDGAV
jgi:hypothetical protein